MKNDIIMANSSGGIRNSVYRGGDYKCGVEVESMKIEGKDHES